MITLVELIKQIEPTIRTENSKKKSPVNKMAKFKIKKKADDLFETFMP